jgi:hypothetical protein
MRLSLICLTVCFLAPATGRAQVGREFVSAEAYVALARVIYVGTIIELTPIKYDKLLSEIQKIGKPYRLVFEVSETIRGNDAKRVELVLSLQSTHFLEHMREHAAPIMLVGGPNPIDSYPRPEVGIEEQDVTVAGQWYQFRLLEPVKVSKSGDEAEIAQQLNSNYDSCRMFTHDLDVVSGREAILKRVRAFAKEHPSMLKCLSLDVPNEFGALCGHPNAYCCITLPLCTATRKTLLAVKNDPGIILRPIEAKLDEQIRARLKAEAEGMRTRVRAATEKALSKLPDDGK